jgi:copper chaperone CopZ
MHLVNLKLIDMNLKKLTSGIALMLLILTLTSCGGSTKKAENEAVAFVPASIEVSISGMTCSGCEQTVQTTVAKLDGIKSVKASFQTGNAVIEYNAAKVDSLKIKEAINGSGYTVKKFSAVHPEPISE